MSKGLPAIGFDVGGQAIKAVLAATDGQLLAKAIRSTGLGTRMDDMQSVLAGLISELASVAPVNERIGVGIAGVLGSDGVLRGSPNLPRLVGARVAASLQVALGRPVIVDNDANCAALAEGWCGATEGCSHYLLVTLGSGVGSGLVVDGQLYHGGSGYGCELGHSIVVWGGRTCGCGNRGCLEAYVSESAARAMVAESDLPFRERVERLHEAPGQGFAQSLFELAERGDREASALVEKMVDMLGAGLASAVNVLDVTTLVLGGGIAPDVMKRLGRLRKAMGCFLFARDSSSLTIMGAALGTYAGAIGAARLALSRP